MLAAILMLAGCPRQPQSDESGQTAGSTETAAPAEEPASPELEMEGDFFSGEALTEGAVELGDDFEGVPCAGAATNERYDYEHPKVIRGQVVAPSGELASNTLWDLLVPSAHAVPVNGERLVDGATVRVARWTDGGVVALDKPRATTDALGRFCIRLPSHLSPGTKLLLEASTGRTVMRRFLYDRADANISSATETLVRLVVAHDAKNVSRAELVNLHTVAFSQLDTIAPVSLLADDDVDAAVATLTEALNESERVRTKLDALEN